MVAIDFFGVARDSSAIAPGSDSRAHNHPRNTKSRQCVRAVKEIDSKAIGLCPQGFESPRCRFHSPDQHHIHLGRLCAISDHANGMWEALYISVTPAAAVT